MQVVEGSPAEAAGLRPEDLILDVDGAPMSDVGDLQRLMVEEAIGRPMTVRVFRDGRIQEVTARPVELEA